LSIEGNGLERRENTIKLDVFDGVGEDWKR